MADVSQKALDIAREIHAVESPSVERTAEIVGRAMEHAGFNEKNLRDRLDTICGYSEAISRLVKGGALPVDHSVFAAPEPAP